MAKRDSGVRANNMTRRDFLKGSALAAAGTALTRNRLLTGIVAAASLPQRQDVQAIDVTDPAYGARGDGTTDDRAAFQAAIDAAIAAGLPLWVPAPSQFYRIVLSGANPQLTVAGDLAVVGAGKDTTLLRYSLADNNTGVAYNGFFVENGSNFQMADLRLEEDTDPAAFEIQGVFFESGGEDHLALLENVDIDGFTRCVYVPSSGSSGIGELFLSLRGCDLHPGYGYAVAFWAVEGGHKRLHMYDCYLHDNQFSHLVYCHPHNSVHVENCRFDGATSWAFQFQGSSVAGNPDYQRFVGCWFGPRNSRGIITQDRPLTVTEVEVRNCVFEGRPSIQIRSDILVDGCYFTTTRDSEISNPFVSAYNNGPWRATIRNCIFAPKANCLPQVDMRLEDIEVSIENCQFFNQNTGTMLNLGRGANNTFTVRDCLFYNRSDNASQSVSLEIDNGAALIDGCHFIGRAYEERGTIFFRSVDAGPAPQTSVQVDNCTFQNISGGSVFSVMAGSGNSWSDRIFGTNNRMVNIQTGKPMLTVTPGGVTVYAHLEPAPGTDPNPLTAAGTMVVTSNFDAYRVVGTAEVSRLHWWTPDGLSDSMFSGVISLLATEPFSLVGGGNIQLPGGRRDVAANQQVSLRYSSNDGAWTEVV